MRWKIFANWPESKLHLKQMPKTQKALNTSINMSVSVSWRTCFCQIVHSICFMCQGDLKSPWVLLLLLGFLCTSGYFGRRISRISWKCGQVASVLWGHINIKYFIFTTISLCFFRQSCHYILKTKNHYNDTKTLLKDTVAHKVYLCSSKTIYWFHSTGLGAWRSTTASDKGLRLKPVRRTQIMLSVYYTSTPGDCVISSSLQIIESFLQKPSGHSVACSLASLCWGEKRK